MALGQTSGTSAAASEPVDSSTQWDSILSDGIASTGIDPNGSFEETAPTELTPQSAPSGSSDGASPSGGPSAPQSAAPGDGGQGQTAPSSTSTTPAPVAAQPDAIPDSQPFTYTVDGQTKTIDGAYVLPGDGLYVPEAKVPHFQLLASNAESLNRQNRELDDRVKSWERLTTHSFTNDQKQPVTLSGEPGLRALREEAAMDKAALHTLVNVFMKPENLASLVEIACYDRNGNRVNPDDPNVVQVAPIRNETAWKQLVERSQFAVEKSRFSVQQQLVKLSAPLPPPEPSVQDLAGPTIKAAIQQTGTTGLTPQDEQFLAGQFPRYVRATTPQERQAYGTPTIVDESFVALVKQTASLRAESAKSAQASTTANTFNAGMNQGRGPARRPAPNTSNTSSRPTTPAAPAVKVGKQAQWDNILQDALAEITLP